MVMSVTILRKEGRKLAKLNYQDPIKSGPVTDYASLLLSYWPSTIPAPAQLVIYNSCQLNVFLLTYTHIYLYLIFVSVSAV